MLTTGTGVTALVVGTALVLALLGCAQAEPAAAQGASPAREPVAATSTPGPATAPQGMRHEDGFNIADVVFLQQMIPHHELALRMAGLAQTRASSPEVKDFARQFEKDAAEVQQMSAWLSSLGIDPGLVAFGAHSHGGGPTEQDLADLANLSGADFDNRFRDLMMQHSAGATQLARAEAQQGVNSGVRELAARIATRESGRIDTLQKML